MTEKKETNWRTLDLSDEAIHKQRKLLTVTTAVGLGAIAIALVVGIFVLPEAELRILNENITLAVLFTTLAIALFNGAHASQVVQHQTTQMKRQHLIDRLLSKDEHTSHTAHKEAETHTVLNPRELQLYSRYETQTKIEPKKDEQNE